MQTSTSQGHRDAINWINANPELITGLLDIGLLLATISLVITRNSLSRIKANLSQAVENLRQPKTAKYTLDPTQDNKNKIYFYLNRLLNQTEAHWVTLGILSNGQVSQWGYHYLNLKWDFKCADPTHEIPLGQLEAIDPVKLSVDLMNQLSNASQPRVTKGILGYQCLFHGIQFGNLLVAVLCLGYEDQPPSTLGHPEATLDKLKATLGSLISPSQP